MSDKFEDNCGLFGVYGHPDAVALTLRGLATLQHRGQESAGIATSSPDGVTVTKVMGAVKDLSDHVGKAVARAAIGHVRYGTCGRSLLQYAQPFLAVGARGQVALSHNGHIVGLEHLRATVGAVDNLKFANDSQLLVHGVASHYSKSIVPAIEAAFRDVTPAYSVLVLTSNTLCAVRDPLGMRPLSIGRIGAATVFSSETCAYDAVGATHLRDVTPGEIVAVESDELSSTTCVAPSQPPAQCIFELIYFARPDSVMFGHSVAEFRMNLGTRLAIEAPCMADIVVPVPESAIYGGLGYAKATGIDFAMALCRNDFVGRTFIEPTEAARRAAISTKHHIIPNLINGRRVVLVDDSIVRGNTALNLVRRIRAAGASEVHVRITSPPTIASCHFGVDTPDERDLFANGRSLSQMKMAIEADSLEFLSYEGLLHTASQVQGYCTGCFSGSYPIDIPVRLISARTA